MPLTVASDLAERMDDLWEVLGKPHWKSLAIRAGVHQQQLKQWRVRRQRPPWRRLESWAQREGWPAEIFAEGGPMPSTVLQRVAKRPHNVAERSLRPGQGRTEIEELADDPDRQAEGPGWQWDSTDYTQLTDDDVLGMLLHDRPGFLRYLQRQFDRPVPTPPGAKLGYLEFVERIAKEKGATVPAEYIETLRRLIRDRSL